MTITIIFERFHYGIGILNFDLKSSELHESMHGLSSLNHLLLLCVRKPLYQCLIPNMINVFVEYVGTLTVKITRVTKLLKFI